MAQDRRGFLKNAGAACTIAAVGGFKRGFSEPLPARQPMHGMARGLTLLNIRRDDGYRLGVKTNQGILDVPEASMLLRLGAPATTDQMLQEETGPAVNALVEAALKSKTAQKAFLKEENIEYGPAVTRPEKIVCVGLNYRRHAAEIGAQVPKQPVLFNKYHNALNYHGGTIKLPVDAAKKFDYEV